MNSKAPPETPSSAGSVPSRRLGLGKAFLRLLSSRGAAVLVMALMAGVFGLATLVPDSVLSDPEKLARLATERPITHWVVLHLRPSAIATSPYFLLLPGFLFAGIALSIIRRMKLFLRQRRAGLHIYRPQRFQLEKVLEMDSAPQAAMAQLQSSLRRARYTLTEAEPNVLIGTRGKWGFVGSMLFHLGLLLVLLGVGISSLTRMNGEILLAEGFPVPLAPSSFITLENRQHFPKLEDHSVSIRDFMATYSHKGTPVDFALLLSVHRGQERIREEQVRVNQSFAVEGMHVTLHRYGFAPTLVAHDAKGVPQLEGTGILRVIPPGKKDSLALRGGGKLEIQLYPDFARYEGKVLSLSLEPRNPIIAFCWKDKRGKELARGRVGLGKEAMVNGYRLRFSSLTYWGGFLVGIDKGLWWVILGSLAGCLGLFLRFAFPDQALRARCAPAEEGSCVRIEASTRFFPALHEEFIDRLHDKLNARSKEET